MTRSAVEGRLAMVTPIRERMSAWWAGTGVRRSGLENTTWTSEPRLARWRAATRPPPPLPPGPARTVTELGEKRVIASSARLRPAFSIIWMSSICRSSTIAWSTARIWSVVSAGTALRLNVCTGSPSCELNSQCDEDHGRTAQDPTGAILRARYLRPVYASPCRFVSPRGRYVSRFLGLRAEVEGESRD